MNSENRQLVEMLIGEQDAKLKRMKTTAVQLANALSILDKAQKGAQEALRAYMEASGTTRAQIIRELALQRYEAAFLGLSTSRSAKHATISPATAFLQAYCAEVEHDSAEETSASIQESESAQQGAEATQLSPYWLSEANQKEVSNEPNLLR